MPQAQAQGIVHTIVDQFKTFTMTFFFFFFTNDLEEPTPIH